MTSKDLKKIVLNKLSDILKPRQFKKAGNTFTFSNGELTYFVNLQSSQSSTSIILKATINVEIYSPFLYKLEDTSLPEKWRRHYTKRIGFFSDKPYDKWWTISNTHEAQEAADEIASVLLNEVLPTLDTIKNIEDLANLWRQGKSPGLTEYQRKEYLRLLDAVK